MIDIDLPVGVRQAIPKDWRQLGNITGDAFAEDPFNLWIFGKAEALSPVFRTLARDIYLRNGFCHLAGDRGAAMWALQGADLDLPALSLVKLVLTQLIHGSPGAIKRGLAAAATMDRHHPTEPHIYLFTLGTRKAARGQGVGKSLVAPVLEAADRAALPAYLENSNPVNDGFYRSLGFEHTGEFRVTEDAPLVTTMWREPKEAG